ncbi:MAG: prepilin-type N-terminal cleavage/methylation domain-containing protein [Candidatus Komeilibacteria bacterium]
MSRKGFTLLELLVVIAIIGLLSTFAVVSLNSGRAKARDSRRIADAKAVQQAMEFIFDDNGDYDLIACTDTVIPIEIATCDHTALGEYIPNLAQMTDPKSGTTLDCDGSRTATCDISFRTLPTGSATTYNVYFYLEEANDAYNTTGAADCTMTPGSIVCVTN